MIVVVGGIKGGSGKTTAATNLAVLRAADGFDVLLVDADEQESCYSFAQVRSETRPTDSLSCIKLTGPPVGREVRKLAAKYHDIIIDTGGRDTASQRAALSVADVALVPFKPRGSYAEVPALWLIEIRNVLLMNERRGRVTVQGSKEFLEALSVLDIRFDFGEASLADDEVLALARRHRLTAYDAAYLELAKRKGLLLATFDKELIKAAPLEGVALVPQP